QNPELSGSRDPYLDMGYTILPQLDEWIDIIVSMKKSTHQPTLQAGQTGQQATFTLTINSHSSPLVAVDAKDMLPAGWSYVNNSTNITLADGSTSTQNPITKPF
ncbi:MAG: DUF11 domain-containing protein, partial [Thiotrichaceae bacterium]|nr:DUF11 domain-containing protein [Thiotrichaceae bacterium]